VPTTGRSLALLDSAAWTDDDLLIRPEAQDQAAAVTRIAAEQLWGSWVPWPDNQQRITTVGPESFEAGIPAGWSVSGGTLAQSGVAAYDGTSAALITATGGTNAFARCPAVAVRPGARVRILVPVWLPVAGLIQAAVDWYRGGTYLSTSTTTPVTPTASTWTVLDLQVTVPRDADTMYYGPTIVSPGAGFLAYTDLAGATITTVVAGVQIPFEWLSQPLAMRPDAPVNSVTVPLTGGRTAARYTNLTSIAQYGTYSPQTPTLDSQSATDAAALAQYLGTFYADRRQRCPQLTLDLLPRTDLERRLILSVIEGQRITLTGTPATWPVWLPDLIVEGIVHTASVDARTVVWNTSPLIGSYPGAAGPWFTLGSSLLGGPDLMPY
jgi:hypothetical protein